MNSGIFDNKNYKPDWEYLSELCLFMILKKIDAPISQVKLSALNKHWHLVFNIFLDYRRRSTTNRISLLLIPSTKSNRKGKLYSLQAKAKVCEIELPEIETWRYCGFCYGWLATVSEENKIITLSNPFKKVNSITLPQLDVEDFNSGDYSFTVPKVVLSNDPLLCPDSYVVVVIYAPYQKLAVHKSGQKDWIYIDEGEFKFSDILFHKSFVYSIGTWKNLLSFSVNDIRDNGTLKGNVLQKTELIGNNFTDGSYLVKSSTGNLYSIDKHVDFEEVEGCDDLVHSTKRFDIFKLILDEENETLLEKKKVNHMNGDIIFVGDNNNLAVSALDFPQGVPNSIYFTDDYFYFNSYEPFGPRDIGIFHLRDKSFGKYYDFKSSHKDLPPYIWILPQLILSQHYQINFGIEELV